MKLNTLNDYFVVDVVCFVHFYFAVRPVTVSVPLVCNAANLHYTETETSYANTACSTSATFESANREDASLCVGLGRYLTGHIICWTSKSRSIIVYLMQEQQKHSLICEKAGCWVGSRVEG